MIGRFPLPGPAGAVSELLQLALLLFTAILTFGLAVWTEYCVRRAARLRQMVRPPGQIHLP